LDLLVENRDEREALVSAIGQLQETYRRVMEHVSSEARLLRYIWYDMDRNHDGHLDCEEFARLLNCINLQPTIAPTELFKDFNHDHHLYGSSLTY
jgi:hypothetical protein